MGTEWNGDYVSPYAEHGKKSEQVKKITVSIPLKVLKVFMRATRDWRVRGMELAALHSSLIRAAHPSMGMAIWSYSTGSLIPTATCRATLTTPTLCAA